VRIVAGSARGVRLAPVPEGLRPVSDRAREGLFSSLGARVPGARVLDLFAGTGAMGIEALSRGATDAVFVERAHPAAAALFENLERAQVAERATVLTQPVLSVLEGDAQGSPFDLVFLDPPYELGPPELDRTLAALGAGNWLSPGWTVVLTRAKTSSTYGIPLHWTAARELRYGDSLLTLFVEV
jgi:16S rRNA (guanine966-N2)-methyltransferase